MDSRPIGVFDSGIGGISILKELVKTLPNEKFIYFGDSANAPYGTKDKVEIHALVCKVTDYLLSRDCKALVIACNTATSVSAHTLRETHPDIPIVGVEPALKPAVLSKPHPRVLVMATHVTLTEHKFLNLMSQYTDTADILTCQCNGLVEYIEQGVLDGPELESYLRSTLAPYITPLPDAVVLGCTHYPFIKPTVQKIFGDTVQLFDGSLGTAKELKRRLELNDLSASDTTYKDIKEQVEIINSLNTDYIIDLSYKLLQK